MMPFGKVGKTDVLFVHIPKTAGKSIKAHLGLPANCHYPVRWFKENKPDRYDASFSFSFVRNPWDRVSSMYRYYTEVEVNPHVSQLSFDEFVRELCLGEGPLFGPDNDTVLKLTQYEFLFVDGRLGVDFVGKYETLEQDLVKLANVLDIPSRKLTANKKVSSNRNMDFRDNYNEETVDLVLKKFNDDIWEWGYEFKWES